MIIHLYGRVKPQTQMEPYFFMVIIPRHSAAHHGMETPSRGYMSGVVIYWCWSYLNRCASS